jgi:autotransporter family porin
MVIAAALVLVAAGCASSKAALPVDPGSPTTVAASSAADPSGSAAATDSATGSSSTGAGGRFGTLPIGSPLPSDADCAARVRPAKEVRPDNAGFNRTQGHPTPVTADPNNPRFGRVTGAFTGTTDEIIQWVACKWGVDEDVVRAQAAKETYWFQKNLGDFGTDATRCVPGHPIGADGKADHCPESIGIMQVRYPYFQTTIKDAIASTAYNLDLAYALWRSCYEGELQWLNTVERGQDYAAGDLWGCVGSWFAGRWYTDPAKDYIAAVQDYVKQRIWETSGFLEHTEP